MKPKDLFGLANRVVGLIVSLYGMDWLARFSLGQLGYFTLQKTDIVYYLLMGIGNLVVGAYFLRGAPHFVRFAYPDEEKDDDDPESTAEGRNDGAEQDAER